MSFTNSSAGPFLRSNVLNGIPDVVHCFGLRRIEIEKYLESLRVLDPKLSRTNQIHGKRVHRLPHPLGSSIIAGDAFISDVPASVCFVRTADCVPILIADKKHKSVAAIHAGWRGTSKDVVGETIKAMCREFGTDPSDCAASVGPCICGDCYEVGKEVVDAMSSLDIGKDWRVDLNHVDLRKANEALLKKSGIRGDNIEVMPHCTRCDDRFASWRRDRDKRERQFSFIVIDSKRIVE